MGYMHINNLYKNQEILMFKECFALEKVHGCVHGGTLVLMADGSQKSICKLKDGDKILSYNLSSEKLEEDSVEAMFCRPSNSSLTWYKLEFSDGRTLICTNDHPVLTTDGFIKAEDLSDNHIIK